MAKKTASPKESTGETPRRRAPRRVTTAPNSGGAATAPSVGAAEVEPTYEQIAEAAYHRYLQRGGQPGSDFDDWLEAERSLKKRR